MYTLKDTAECTIKAFDGITEALRHLIQSVPHNEACKNFLKALTEALTITESEKDAWCERLDATSCEIERLGQMEFITPERLKSSLCGIDEKKEEFITHTLDVTRRLAERYEAIRNLYGSSDAQHAERELSPGHPYSSSTPVYGDNAG